MTHFAVSRPVQKRTITRSFNGETALEALRQCGFAKDREAFGFNKGQFSFIDLIDAALEFTGPAHATIATWTAADADLRRAAEYLKNGKIKSAKWLIDYSFETRQPAFCQTLRDLFGDDSIITAASHAKFALLQSDDWNITIQTSMNLNQNKRLENFWIADCRDLFAAYSDLVKDICAEQPKTDRFNKAPSIKRGEMKRLGATQVTDPFAGILSISTLL